MEVSEARLAANRANAKHCKGPTSELGKSISRRNSLKHGLTGAGVVVPEGDQAEVEIARRGPPRRVAAPVGHRLDADPQDRRPLGPLRARRRARERRGRRAGPQRRPRLRRGAGPPRRGALRRAAGRPPGRPAQPPADARGGRPPARVVAGPPPPPRPARPLGRPATGQGRQPRRRAAPGRARHQGQASSPARSGATSATWSPTKGRAWTTRPAATGPGSRSWRGSTRRSPSWRRTGGRWTSIGSSGTAWRPRAARRSTTRRRRRWPGGTRPRRIAASTRR